MNNEEQWKKIVTVTALLISIIAVVFVLKTLKGIFVPLVVAVFLTYLFAPVVELLAKIKIPRILTLFILLAIVFLIGTFFAQIIISNIKEFVNYWPTVENKLLTRIGVLLNTYLNIDTTNLFSILQSQRITDLFSNVVSRSFSFVGQFLLTLLILIFIYLTYHNYPRLIKKAFNRQRAKEIFMVLDNINKQIINYIMVKTLISAGTGILTGVACAVLGIKFPIMWGTLAFLLNYIPYIGSLAAVVFPITLSIIQFPHSYIPLIAAASLIAIQFTIGSYLDPEMMGNKFNLSPILIIISLFFWSYVWGVVGAFLAVPIVAVVKIVIQNIESFKFIAVLMSKKADSM
jgi:AI-2 transport protein TqsA